MNLLDVLDNTPNGEHSVIIYPDRRTLRAAFQPYVGKYSRHYRTHSLHRAEYIEDPASTYAHHGKSQPSTATAQSTAVYAHTRQTA